jgi:hypothetical protein
VILDPDDQFTRWDRGPGFRMDVTHKGDGGILVTAPGEGGRPRDDRDIEDAIRALLAAHEDPRPTPIAQLVYRGDTRAYRTLHKRLSKHGPFRQVLDDIIARVKSEK